MNTTQLQSVSDYDANNMTFSKLQIGKVGDTGISYKRINIGTKNKDGSEGELVFATEELFSFGVSENVDKATGKLNGYTVPLCLLSKDNPTKREQDFVSTFDKVVEKCKDYLLNNKKELKMVDLERSDLRKLNPIYIKKNADGEVVEGTSPTLYAKLIVSKKNGQNKILTEFFDSATGEGYNPLDLIGKYCYVRAVIKVESLFLGSFKTLQVKIYEAEVRLINNGVKRLLSRPEGRSKVSDLSSSNVSNPLLLNEEDGEYTDDDGGSIVDEPEPAKEEIKTEPKKKKVVVVKKKATA